MDLVIVESPSKAKTIAKYLGNGYDVIASGGHVSDLPAKKLGVDVEHNFMPEYIVNPDKEKTIKAIKSKVDKADKVYLATDPDREGEAISWHLKNVLRLPDGKIRIEFNEISKKAVNNALKTPRELNLHLVDAQQARRVLDRLVGYKISPIISNKIKKGLSAGRVQSVALKMIVDREREIRAFVPEESWNVNAFLLKEKDAKKSYKAAFTDINGKKHKIKTGEECKAAVEDMKRGVWYTDSVKKALSVSRPNPPFTTSTMQQDASNKLNLTAPETMRIAQQLYEGLEIKGEGHVALVTYIRTDSVRISDDAQKSALDFIAANYGGEYAPKKPNFFSSNKSAQDAHEAIRPITLDRSPESLKDKIDRNQYRLYKLIYERFLASQMTSAEYNTLTVHIVSETPDKKYGFQLKGRTLKFAGFTKVYSNSTAEDEKDDVKTLPSFDEGDKLFLQDIKYEQKFTTPPPRYSDSTLVKGMEENGIGRPSTYASIIQVLAKRIYTEKEGKYLKPTELGEIVVDQLVKYFPDIMNSKFTAGMESKLDKIEEGGVQWQRVVGDFYPDFIAKVLKAMNDGAKVKLKEEESGIICENCGANMVIREGRYGKFLACPNFPNCRNTKKFKEGANGEIILQETAEKKEQQVSDVKCEKCGAYMVVKENARGKFLACPNYPKCKNIKSLEPEITAVCPKCGGKIVRRVNKKGKPFYGCSNYPKCDFLSNDLPAPHLCPDCNSTMRVIEEDGHTKYQCVNKGCGFEETVK